MATSLTLQNDPSLPQGYLKVNGTTAATVTESGIIGNLTGNSSTASDAAASSQLALKTAKAWVNFNGTTSPPTIRSSYNVSSVTKNGTGDYTVNFATAMADSNYSISYAAGNAIGNASFNTLAGTYTTTQAPITLVNSSLLSVDREYNCVQIFGN